MKWEYRVFKFKLASVVIKGGEIDVSTVERDLNQLGGEGWEAVTSFERSIQGITSEVAIVMKRPAA